MADERCRITVVGERRRVDVAVPAQAPIVDYASRLADLCGQDETDAMPPAWSLATAAGPPLDPGVSLESSGVLDGETLYLRNVLDGELDDPVVSDIEEQVAGLDEDGATWSPRTRAATTVVLGLLLLVGAAVALAAGGGPGGTSGAAFPLLGAGVATSLLAWVAGRKFWPVPAAARLAMAAATCPLLAGAVLALPLHDPGGRLAAGSVAALAGAVVAYFAAPSTPTLVLTLACALETPLAVPLVLIGADAAESAAVAAVVVFQLLAVLPRLASQAATLPTGVAEIDDVAGTVRRVQRLLVLFNTACCAVLVACLAVLSASPGWWPPGLALCLSVALLGRAVASRLTAVVAGLLVSGSAGLAALALRAPDRFPGLDLSGRAAPLLILAVGAVVLWGGLVMCFRSALRQGDAGERWRWPASFAAFLGAVAVPLAAGVFGLLDGLFDAGRGL